MPGLALQIAASVVNGPDTGPVRDWCTCEYTCDWEEIVFSGADDYQQDKTSFLTRRLSPTDTLAFNLYKDGVQVATITDNTYGTFYDFGSFTVQPDYLGWVADWTLIVTALGTGLYQVKTEGTIAGVTVSFESRLFRAMPYDQRIAHRTVKLEGYQTGNILSSEFDYTGLLTGGWYQSIRLNGYFGDYQPSIEVDDYLTTSYQAIQNRTEIKGRYILTAEGIPHSIFRDIAQDQILGNELYVTDYEARADVVYRRYPVAVEGFEDTQNWSNGRGLYRIAFQERTQNTIKRNF